MATFVRDTPDESIFFGMAITLVVAFWALAFALRNARKIGELRQQRNHVNNNNDDDDDNDDDIYRVIRPAERLRKGMRACCVCLEKRASICLVPCAHQDLCDNCILPLWHRGLGAEDPPKCPTCRAEILWVVRPYV